MFDIRRILIPIDLSDASGRALQYGRFLAERLGAALTVMYADPIVYPIDVMGASPILTIAATPEHEAALRDEVKKFADPKLEEIPYATIVSIGQPVPMILRAAEESRADLILMGTHAQGWHRAILGSVTHGVLHESRIPVMTISTAVDRPFTDRPGIHQIVCPTNFTPTARESLRAAVRLAGLFDAELVVVHVIEPNDVTDAAADEQRVRGWIAPDLQGMTRYRELVVRGGAAERVLDCVEDMGSDLLVIGAEQKIFRNETVIGTTTERLIRFAPCPVLTVAVRAGKARVEKIEEVDVQAAAALP